MFLYVMEYDRRWQEIRDKDGKLFEENLRRELYYIMAQMWAQKSEVLSDSNFVKIYINWKYELLCKWRKLEINKTTKFDDVIELDNWEIEVKYDGKSWVFDEKGFLVKISLI